TGWVCTQDAGTVTCTSAAGIAGGSPATPALAPPITLTVRVAADAGPSVLLNQASVDGPQTDPDLTNNDDSDAVVVVDAADVSIVKDVAGAGPFVAGEQVTYTLTVGNAGPSDADGVHVVDDLPA